LLAIREVLCAMGDGWSRLYKRTLVRSPRQIRAKFARRSKLVRAKIDRRHTTFGADEPSALIHIEPTAAADLQHALAGAQIEGFQHRAAPRYHVLTFGQVTLESAVSSSNVMFVIAHLPNRLQTFSMIFEDGRRH
jgi:hypothetical protein